MRKHVTMALAASALLLAGCATAPHAYKWEYKVASPHLAIGRGPEDAREAQQAFLDELGKEGWVLISQSDGRVFYFARPIK